MVTAAIFSVSATRLLALSGGAAHGVDAARHDARTHQPTQVAGRMSSSDLEHFPFDANQPPAVPSGATGSGGTPNEGVPPASRDARIFRDAGGVTWWVHEVAGEHLGAPGPTCLLVVSANELRRVWRFPADWRSLSPDQLLALPPAK